MSEKLSERLIDTLQTVYALGVSRGSPAAHSIREAIAIVRTVEDAPEGVFGIPVWGSACLLANERFLGKRVKLVEVK